MRYVVVILTLLALLTLASLAARADSDQVAAVLSQQECAEAMQGGAANCEVAHYQANGVRVTIGGLPWIARHGQMAVGVGGGAASSSETGGDGTGGGTNEGGAPTPTPTPSPTPTPQVNYFPYYDAWGYMLCDNNGMQALNPLNGEPTCEELMEQGWQTRPWQPGD